MDFESKKLGEVITLQRGYDLASRDRQAGNIPVVSSSGVTGFHNAARADGPGVVIGRYGTLGQVFYLECPYWPLNTSLFVKDFKGNHPRFVSYLLKTIDYDQQNAAGAVPGVNRNHLHQIKVRIPLLPIQRRIASVLSAYDDLIENNTRRIGVLEEMARRAYMTLFSKPDIHPTNDGSSSWRKGRIGDLITLQRGYDLPGRERQDGEVPVISSSGVTGFHRESRAKAPGVVTGRYGTLGQAYFVDVPFWPLNTALFVSDFKGSDPYFVHQMLGQMDIEHQNAAGAVPGINRAAIHAMECSIPPIELQRRYGELVAPKYRLVTALEKRNDLLRAARDLLLPKLLSGELSVDRIPDPAAVAP